MAEGTTRKFAAEFRAHGALLAVTILAGLGVELAKAFAPYQLPETLIELFGLSYEKNFPTWISSLQLFACAVLLFGITRTRRARGAPDAAHWGLLAVGFAYLSLDEFAQIHESMNSWFDLGGALYFGWIIPAGIAVIVVGLLYLRFLWRLPARTRGRIVLAGGLYVGGALGVEQILGLWTDRHGDQNLVYALIDWVEESFEILGSGLFLQVLVAQLFALGAGEPETEAPVPATTLAAWSAVAVASCATLLAVSWETRDGGTLGATVLEEIVVEVRTIGARKPPGAALDLWLVDARGQRLAWQRIGFGQVFAPGRIERTLTELVPAPLAAECEAIFLHYRGWSQSSRWKWNLALSVEATRSDQTTLELLPVSPLELGSESQKNLGELPSSCRPVDRTSED